jgi:NADH-quinone oxidoreductase subunit J
MNAGSLLFAVCALLCSFGALTVVISKNPIRGAMGLLTTILGIAGLFLRLSAEFLAAMQLLVYAGAVVILFVFVVMLLGANAHVTDRHSGRSLFARAAAGVLLLLVGVACVILFSSGAFHDFPIIESTHGTVESVGGLLFRDGLVPFEVATVLLIVAVVGAIAVARTKPSSTKQKQNENPTLRMYHGPLHPRDSEKPLTGTLAERVQAEAKKETAS